jgi:hypothetical protein
MMSCKPLISAMLLLMLVFTSASGLACDVRCGLGMAAAGHSNASAAMDMSTMHCQSIHHADASRSGTAYELMAQGCHHGHCDSEAGLTADRGFMDGASLAPVASAMAVFQLADSGASTALAARYRLTPAVHRPFTVLRI